LQPFLQYILGAVLIAYVLYPLQVRFQADTSPSVVAFALLVLSVVGLIAPFVIVFITVVDAAERILQDLNRNPAQIERVESRIEELLGREVNLTEEIVEAGREIGAIVIERSTEVFGTITFHLLGIALALFLVYYLLKDGNELLGWLNETIPLPAEQRRDLYSEIDDVMWGVIFGHVAVGIVQGIVAGVGFFVTGVPNPVFWTAVMVVLAMVPLVGTIPVWGGAVVYLYLTNEPGFAAGLFIYSVVVVGLTDDYLRPFAVDRYAKLNPAVILLGILGGAYVFGVMGLFFGPVVLGALKASLRVLSDDYARIEDEYMN
ncbi:AI-2E family transporter, partial [Halorubrum sp. AD140]|uniref:AI-2E family transporter n=1 Tax=Halorubrum sp. AD140 TaxID=3050073 RepID=UPI002ACD1694